MRFIEFSNAEDQLALLRVIIDNTWSAIAQQAEQQRRQEAQRRMASKRNKGSGKALTPSAPVATQPLKIHKAPLQPKPNSMPSIQAATTKNSEDKTGQKSDSTDSTSDNKDSSNGIENGPLTRLHDTHKSAGSTNDRYSKNGSLVKKK